MTHSLHRYGEPSHLTDDYIVFAMPARSVRRTEAVVKQKEFLRRALRHGPVNIGDAKKGGWDRPRRGLNPLVHWRRDTSPKPEEVIDGVDTHSLVSAVFDNVEAARAFVRELKEADLGLSINMSSLADRAVECCGDCGLTRHSVEYSLGFRGATSRLPDDVTLELSTMCGHGMIAHSFVEKMVDRVRQGRLSPGDASRYMARFCVCSIFNPSRATRILEGCRGRAAAPPP